MFSRDNSSDMAWTDGHDLIIEGEHVMPLTAIKLVGPHNLENILAAITVSKIAGVTNEAIKSVLEVFGGHIGYNTF